MKVSLTTLMAKEDPVWTAMRNQGLRIPPGIQVGGALWVHFAQKLVPDFLEDERNRIQEGQDTIVLH